MKMEQSVPKRWHIKFRCLGITQKKALKIYIYIYTHTHKILKKLNAYLYYIKHIIKYVKH